MPVPKGRGCHGSSPKPAQGSPTIEKKQAGPLQELQGTRPTMGLRPVRPSGVVVKRGRELERGIIQLLVTEFLATL